MEGLGDSFGIQYMKHIAVNKDIYVGPSSFCQCAVRIMVSKGFGEYL